MTEYEAYFQKYHKFTPVTPDSAATYIYLTTRSDQVAEPKTEETEPELETPTIISKDEANQVPPPTPKRRVTKKPLT